MSGIAGCFNLDGAPADRALLERMMGRLAHRGPDGSGLWTDGAVGLAHLAFHTTPESVREHQPLADANGLLHLTMDGRVDNRVELLADLRAKGIEPRDDTDAELVLQAYRCWGEECPVHIVGDFAFAIWDFSKERLFCARDIVGMRSLLFFRDARTFAWATEAHALLEHPSVTRAPNERAVAAYLCNTVTSSEETIFRDIARLAPGHSLTVTRAGLRARRYWNVEPRRAIRYRTDDEYAEHFKTIFRESVRCRLRSQGPIAADLSGGLDSSSIVGMVETLLEDEKIPKHCFGVFSLVFPGLPCDERRYIKAVARHWNLAPVFAQGAVLNRDYYEAQVRRYLELAYVPNGAMFLPLRQQQTAIGARVILDGTGGDEWFAGSGYHCADLLRRGRLLTAARHLRAVSAGSSCSYARKYALRFGLWPLLPISLRMWLRGVLAREGGRAHIANGLSDDLPPAASLCRESVLGEGVSFDQADMFAILHSGERSQITEEAERWNSRLGIELRWPFMDRRLIEFAFALPEDQRWRGNTRKFVLRNAMRGLVPELVLERADKADFSHVIVETLHGRGAGSPWQCPQLERRNWVVGEEARRIYGEMLTRYNQKDERYSELIWPAWNMFSVETWLKEAIYGQ